VAGKSKRELLVAPRPSYLRASKSEKGQILDRFALATGCHRSMRGIIGSCGLPRKGGVYCPPENSGSTGCRKDTPCSTRRSGQSWAEFPNGEVEMLQSEPAPEVFTLTSSMFAAEETCPQHLTISPSDS
jgi:hypothetical protein